MKLRIGGCSALIWIGIGFTSLQADPIHHSDVQNDAAKDYQEAKAAISTQNHKPDYEKAHKLLDRAVDSGNAEAKGLLGYLLQRGLGKPKDLDRAMILLDQAANAGIATASLNLGVLLEERGSPDSLRHYEKAAEANYRPARVKLAEIHYFGELQQPWDFKKALPYVSSEASRGNPRMQNILGTMFEFGQGVQASKPSAITWYELAARLGNAKAQANLGRMLKSIPTPRPDPIKPYIWLKLAADQGEPSAVILLKDHIRLMTQEQIQAGNHKSLEIKVSNKDSIQSETISTP